MLEFSPYLLLALAILSLWINRTIIIWGSLFLLALILGFLTHKLTLLSIPSIFAVGILYYLTFKKSCPIWLRILCGVLASVLSCALAEQQIPGFAPLNVVSDVVLHPKAYPYTLHLNFDKALIGLIILGFGWDFINRQALTLKKIVQIIPIVIVGIFIILLIAIGLHFVEFDPRWTPLFWIWSFSNLIFVCVGEEAFFRGFIQNILARAFSTYFQKPLLANALAIFIASFIFGLVHFYGGPKFIFLATCVGLLCGYCYYKTGRIEASIFTHFLVNATHFLGFTYPALQQF